MTASKIHFRLILVAQIWIYLPCPLMILPDQTKEPYIPLICFQLPFMLPLGVKNTGNYDSTLNTPSEPPQVILLTYDALQNDHTIKREKYGCGMEKRWYWSRIHDGIICNKNWGYITLRVLFIRGFITFMDLTEWSKISVLASLNIIIVQTFLKLIDVFSSLLSIPSPVELIFVIFLFLFSWSHTVPVLLTALIETLTLPCCYCLLKFMRWKPCQEALLFWPYLCL